MVARRGASTAAFVAVVAACMLLSLLVKLPMLGFSHEETDEVIYWQLAKKLAAGGDYSLQGTGILERLSPRMYDRNLFHHPPLFAGALVPFAKARAMRSAVVVSWLGHLLCIAAVGLIGRQVMAGSAFAPAYWIPLVGIALDPMMLFVSRKLWMDGLLAGLTAMSVALFFVACRSNRGRRALLPSASVLLGLAALTKLTALLVVPALAYIVLAALPTRRERVEALLYGGAPAALLIAPWFVMFYQEFGTLLPSWTRPDAWTLERFPFMQLALDRPGHYYLTQTLLLQPLALLIAAAFVRDRRRLRNLLSIASLLWCGLYLVVLTGWGLAGQGFVMRFVLPLFPSLYVMAYTARPTQRRAGRVFDLAAAACIVIAIGSAAPYLFEAGPSEIRSVFDASRMAGLNP